jgi:peptide/nickel transport system permease protein
MISIQKIRASKQWKSFKKQWYKFSKNPLSVAGLVVVAAVIFSAILAPYIVPYPEDAETFQTHLERTNRPPTLQFPFGTDRSGLDILSRVIFGFRYSLMMAAVILALVVPPGVVLGLVAGYYAGTWIDTVIMRITDVFLGVPPLILALAVCSVLPPNIFNAMMAVSLMWWPWYARLVYSLASSLKNEYFVQAAEIIGARTHRIIFREILPNCLGPILTKITLDVGWVILIGASLSFLGLGAPAPTPDLGTMVADGRDYLATQWWISAFPAIAIVIIILGFNLLGDGVRDVFATEEA